MRPSRRSSVDRIWQRVRLHADCYRGCRIVGGEWALFVKVGYQRFCCCILHADEDYGMQPPAVDRYEPAEADAKTKSLGE